MAKKKKTSKKKSKRDDYSSLSVTKPTMERFKMAHAKWGDNLTSLAFAEAVVDLYILFHCPECGDVLKPRTCACKLPENL